MAAGRAFGIIPMREWLPLLAPWPFIVYFLLYPEQLKAIIDWLIRLTLTNE